MRNSVRFQSSLWIGLLLAFILAAPALASEDNGGKQLYLPAVLAGSPPPAGCDIPNTGYETVSVAGPSLSGDVSQNIDVNLGYRGYEQVDAPRQLVVLGPVHDGKAPQVSGMFADRRTPAIVQTYQRYRWDDGCDCVLDTYSRWDTTVLGLGVSPGETIYTPDSGYDIGGGYEYLVMYAAETRITLHIGREDDFPGYVIHIEDVCTDPDLLALYNQANAAGRNSLPALGGHQPFGKALGSEIKIAMRDSGSFMDPRSRNDWWQGR